LFSRRPQSAGNGAWHGRAGGVNAAQGAAAKRDAQKCVSACYDAVMADPDPRQQRLDQLRRWHTRPRPDLSLKFLGEQFKRQVAKPYKQLAQVSAVWTTLVPPELAAHCRLDAVLRGVLRVAVEDSAHLYDLDRLLRQGLERQLLAAAKGPALRRVQLFIAPAPFAAPRPAAVPGKAEDDVL
jgi:hypothetical protein